METLFTVLLWLTPFLGVLALLAWVADKLGCKS